MVSLSMLLHMCECREGEGGGGVFVSHDQHLIQMCATEVWVCKDQMVGSSRMRKLGLRGGVGAVDCRSKLGHSTCMSVNSIARNSGVWNSAH